MLSYLLIFFRNRWFGSVADIREKHLLAPAFALDITHDMSKKDIVAISGKLADYKSQGHIVAWELPYETLLTRLSAAAFFVDVPSETALSEISDGLKQYPDFKIVDQHNSKLSKLRYKITFGADRL